MKFFGAGLVGLVQTCSTWLTHKLVVKFIRRELFFKIKLTLLMIVWCVRELLFFFCIAQELGFSSLLIVVIPSIGCNGVFSVCYVVITIIHDIVSIVHYVVVVIIFLKSNQTHYCFIAWWCIVLCSRCCVVVLFSTLQSILF